MNLLKDDWYIVLKKEFAGPIIRNILIKLNIDTRNYNFDEMNTEYCYSFSNGKTKECNRSNINKGYEVTFDQLKNWKKNEIISDYSIF